MDNGLPARIESAAGIDGNVLFFSKLHGMGVQHLGAGRAHFLHNRIGNLGQVSGLGHDRRIRRVNAVYIGINLTALGIKGRCQGHGGGIRAAASQGGNVALVAYPLKATDDHDLALGHFILHSKRPDLDHLGIIDNEEGEPEIYNGAMDNAAGVATLLEAARESDFIVTATGDKHVVDKVHMEVMKDGCVLANSGHFNVELDLPDLAEIAKDTRLARPMVEEFTLADAKRLYVLGEGRLMNLAAAEGHPSSVMDMSFANQCLAVEYLVRHGNELSHGVHPVPREIDEQVALLKLASMGIAIDSLTDEQQHYLVSWQEGT